MNLAKGGQLSTGPASTCSWGEFGVILGGYNNIATSPEKCSDFTGSTSPVVTGGSNNIVSGRYGTVSGGNGLTVNTDNGWAAGTAPSTFSAP